MTRLRHHCVLCKRTSSKGSRSIRRNRKKKHSTNDSKAIAHINDVTKVENFVYLTAHTDAANSNTQTLAQSRV